MGQWIDDKWQVRNLDDAISTIHHCRLLDQIGAMAADDFRAGPSRAEWHRIHVKKCDEMRSMLESVIEFLKTLKTPPTP